VDEPARPAVQRYGGRYMRDRNRRPERGECEPIKISLEIDPSTYIPKSPQTLHLGYVRIAIDKLSHSSTP